jgi:hypothetical protein
MKKTYQGQILIILMLALAIISIMLVMISKNVRRDTLDQIQSEQYEEYYSAVEQELLKIISGQSLSCPETATSCDIELTGLQYIDGLSKRMLYVFKDEIINFSDIVVGKDKSITIPLDNYRDNLKFSWKGEVAWVVNIDYKIDSTGEYKTSQSIYDNFDIFNPNSPISCLNFTPDGTNSFEFDIKQCLNQEEPFEPYTPISIRMKPLMRGSDSTELSLLEPTSGLPPQAKVIIATAEIDDDLGNSPAIQLELQIPMKDPTLEILDYALRTNKTVFKPKP